MIATVLSTLLMLGQGGLTPQRLAEDLKHPTPDLTDQIRKWFGGKLGEPQDAKVNGLDVAWAIEVPGGSSVLVHSSTGGDVPLAKLEGTHLFAAARHFAPKTGFRWQFQVDGRNVGPERNLELYEPDPYSVVDPTVAKGRLVKMPKWKSQVFAGTERDWWLYIPPNYNPQDPPGLMVFQDGQSYQNYTPTVFDNLIAKNEIPSTACVFIAPGVFADGKSDRSFEYDTLSDQYVRFLLDEIVPEVKKSINLNESADRWAISGISSGGICAFTAAWQRPDKFSKVLSWVGSFTNIAGGASGIAGGHNYPALIRRNDPKPIRVFLQDGSNDLDNPFGNWYLSNLQMAAALKFKGYDYRLETGNGFHSDRHGRSMFGESLKWLWRK